MAHFLRPPSGGASGYDVDGKVAPGSVWRMQVPLGGARAIALWGGGDLTVRSNNPGVVPNEFGERSSGDLRLLTLKGRSPGTSMLEAGVGGQVWTYVQVQVVAGSSVCGFVKPKGEENPGAKLDQKGQLWRQEIFVAERAFVGLSGGRDLIVSSNNPAVAQTGAEIVRGGVRVFPVVGLRTGDAMIEATVPRGQPGAGSVLAHLQVHVFPARPDRGPICSGPEAARRAMEILKTSVNLPAPGPYPTPYGPVTLQVGQVWGPKSRLILAAGWDRVEYLEKDTLYSVRTADLAREILLDGMIEGMNRARPMAELSRVVMQVVLGIFAGPAVSAAGIIIELTLLCGAYRAEIEELYRTGPRVFAELRSFREACPVTWGVLVRKIEQHTLGFAWDAVKETVSNPNNIGFFIGRVIRACLGKKFADIQMGIDEIPKLTLGKLAFYLGECAVAVTLLHLPEGVLDAAAETSRQLKTSFAKPGLDINLSDDEAAKVNRELAGYTEKRLRQLAGSLDDYQALLQKLTDALKRANR
ncbi:MAG TPA: hypothetical protein VN914_09995 [Polyangia bacterium]|nr:hypothetical protein [Polyangia bacterium]